ncbi:MAG: ABC transporter ATP-binding protein/permease [Propionibacteriaceae bacterium]|jgi:ABC-type multidrug transport system fused ATPase/permease subunit|nr:ABC transporter ATP-binding protein/permease [Propionibacteriaceae bacterium]
MKNGQLVLTVALGWVTGLAQLTAYLAIGHGVDAYLDSRVVPVAVWVVSGSAVTLAAVAAWAGLALTGRGQGTTEAATRRTLMAHVFALGPADRERAGRLVSSLTDGVERAAAFRATFLAPMIASVTLPVLVLAVVAVRLDPVAAGWLAIGVPLVPVAVGGFQAIFRTVSARYRAHARELSAQFLDAIQGLPTLRYLGAGPDTGRRLARSAEGLRRLVMRLLAGNQVVLLVVDTGFSLAFIVVGAVLAVVRYGSGHLSVGGALALVLASTLLLEPLDRIGQFFYVGMGGIAATREIRATLAEVPVVREPGDETAAGRYGTRGRYNTKDESTPAGPDPTSAGREPGAGSTATPFHAPAQPGGAPSGHSNRETELAGSPTPVLEFDGVGFAYDTTPVLDNVTFSVQPGETVALTGVSGAGKTTIAALVLAERRPGQGVVRLLGRDVTTQPLAWQRAQTATVAQTTYLFTGTLRDNLHIAAPGASDDELWAALAAADLETFVRDLPLGLDTPVGERGLALSGGQTQRLAIARAYLKDAPLLVLDEPTAHVDLASERAILAALHRLGRNRSVLTISHRRATIADADRVLVLADRFTREDPDRPPDHSPIIPGRRTA